ncbi:hypothetical protein CMV30_04375 [Nibricoccus aquaticus]|uniref:Uncharacterized protein n=2 Tax=Nibricoccus aquaticus TaxID=2576891 RepID=A0A290Q7V5_9BACT|nr:hypothetical protein CMV30_04375 [Nibricoccus aquaticus]
MQEREVTSSYTPAMLAVGPPWLIAYRGDTRLFVLHWKHKTKFQLIEAQDEAIRGSYEVPEDWYLRYLALCEKIRAGDGSQNVGSGRATSLRRVEDNASYLGGLRRAEALHGNRKRARSARSTSEVFP